MKEHTGDDAQLFALGVLDPQERAAVETHARDCAACSIELGRPEATVAAMNHVTALSHEPPDRLGERIRASATQASTTARRPIPSVDRVRGWYAIAALLVLGLLVVNLDLAERAPATRFGSGRSRVCDDREVALSPRKFYR